MRFVRLGPEAIGLRLGMSVTDAFVGVLLNAGTELSTRYIDRLQERGFDQVLVADELSADIEPEEAVRLVVQAETASVLKGMVEGMATSDAGSSGRGRLSALQAALSSVMQELRTNPAMAVQLTALRSSGDYLFLHAVNVCAYALVLGQALALGGNDLTALGVGALLQDVGMHGYVTLAARKGPLSAEERAQVRAHTADGYRVAKQGLEADPRSAHMAFQHHERLDGSGYPRGLSGSQVILFTRVGAIAGVFHALTSPRSYREAVPPDEAMRLLQEKAGTGFDAFLVRKFANRVAVYPTGSAVQLDSGEIAIVARQSARGPVWPVVRVVTDPKMRLVQPFEAELGKSPGGPAVRQILADLPRSVREQLAVR